MGRPDVDSLAADVPASESATWGVIMGVVKARFAKPSPSKADAYPWDASAIAASVQEVLDALEITEIDPEARRALQRIFYRRNTFEDDGRGHVVLLLKTFLESEGNGDAIIEPIVTAVSMCMLPAWTKGIAWLEAFDKIPLRSILETMRGLDLFGENALGHYYQIALRNKLAQILNAAEAPKPAKQKAERKPPRVITQVAGVAKNIALGLELLDLRRAISHNLSFGRQARHRFNIDGKHCAELMRVARAYGGRPEIFTKVSWHALLMLASPSMPAGVREGLEARIIAGGPIGAPQIRAARGRIARPADQTARRMAA
jgi:hypothetical protein